MIPPHLKLTLIIFTFRSFDRWLCIHSVTKGKRQIYIKWIPIETCCNETGQNFSVDLIFFHGLRLAVEFFSCDRVLGFSFLFFSLEPHYRWPYPVSFYQLVWAGIEIFTCFIWQSNFLIVSATFASIVCVSRSCISTVVTSGWLLSRL